MLLWGPSTKKKISLPLTEKSINFCFLWKRDRWSFSGYLNEQTTHESQTSVISLGECILLNPSSLFWKVKIPLHAQHILSTGMFRVTANSQYKNFYHLLSCYPISVSLQTQQGSWVPMLYQCNRLTIANCNRWVDGNWKHYCLPVEVS